VRRGARRAAVAADPAGAILGRLERKLLPLGCRLGWSVASPPVSTGLLWLALVSFAVWAWWSAGVAYDFSNPTARAWLVRDSQYYPDLVSRLPAGWPRVLSGLLFLASGLGLGHLALLPLKLRWRGSGERALFEVGAGLMAWTYLTLALGSVGLLYRGAFLPLAGGGLVLAGLGWARAATRAAPAAPADPGEPGGGGRSRRLRLVLGLATALLLAVTLYLALLGALGPEVQFDGRWYHLAQVKHYLQRGSLYNMVAETRIGVVGLPAYHQLLLTAAAALFDLRVAKLLPWFEGLLAALVVVCICRHHFASRLMGAVAALLFVGTPLVGWCMATSANDLMVALLSLFAIHAYLRWRSEPVGWPWLVVLGALCGFAAGVKPFALVFAAVLFLGVAAESWRARAGGPGAPPRRPSLAAPLLVAGGAALVAVAPWLVRSYLTTGNPVFPFLDGLLFDSPYWSSLVDAHYRSAVQGYGAERSLEWFLLLPLRTVTRADCHRGVVGPLFLLMLPVVAVTVVAARGSVRGVVRRLALYSALAVTLWFASGLLEIRYALFLLPTLAILIAYSLVEHRWPGRVGRAFQALLVLASLAVTALNLYPFVPFQAHGTEGLADRPFIPWPQLFRGAPEDSLTVANQPMVAYLNRHLTAGLDKVYDGTKGRLVVFSLYCDVELFNGDHWDGPRGLGEWDLGSPDAPLRLVGEGITHVVVASARWPAHRLRPSGLWSALEEVWRSPDGKVLYRFDVRALRSTLPPGRLQGRPVG
jgi:hypothetical protein